MTLIDKDGNVLLEREKPRPDGSRKSIVRIRKISKRKGNSVRPQLMSKEEFFHLITNTNDKTVFQFRTPSEGGNL